ncbi:unnamed protein product [Symbiodinium sp. CCMP2592]|nr:unnamed protein product [Symbiodinium sp. CCMP2592]
MALIAPSNKKAIQINLPKSSGGFRPLSMMEEAFKLIEGPVTQRMATSRSLLELGAVYSKTNLAYEKKHAATTEVLYTDCILCEIAVRTGAPFARVPSDYEKYFNSILYEEVDAIQLARGIPDMVRRLYTDAFQGITVAIDTRWGLTRDVDYQRGVPQGTISSPELSKPAQEPILRMRELSPARFVTDHGIGVAVTAYADDAEHYAGGIRQLPQLLQELGKGSVLAAVGYAWPKFSAYASDWNSVLGTEWAANHGITQDGIRATGYDIWTGGTVTTVLPRSHADSMEKLLGKRGTIINKHDTAAQDLLDKLSQLRQRMAFRNCDWDEIAAAFQLIGRGYISYAPLVGIPSPTSLHLQDADLQLLILKRLQVRCSVERVSLLAPREIGGVQLPSMVEAMVAAVGSDLLLLLNGKTTSSGLARAELRMAMQLDPDAASAHQGIVCRAMVFLAGYGIYLSVSTERLLSRLLDHLKTRLGSPHAQFVGPADEWAHQQGAQYCRVGRFANSLRRALDSLRHAVDTRDWGFEHVWQQHLEHSSGLSPSDCAAAMRAATTASSSDWKVECGLFHRPFPNAESSEDWATDAWDNPWANKVDSRSDYLDSRVEVPFHGLDFGMYSDGGMLHAGNCTFSSQARSFGGVGDYWESSHACTERLISRLPLRLGYEAVGVHEAEMAAMIAALRWRRPEGWNLLVVDRSSLCYILQQVKLQRPSALLGLASHFLVGRLQRILADLRCSWRDPTLKPSWRLQQEALPAIWNCKQQNKWMCNTTHCTAGLVAVDIKSHQEQSDIPHPVITRGNAQQDEGCGLGRNQMRPPDVRYPTGGFFAFLVMDGRAIGNPIRKVVRKQLRIQASAQWAQRRVQGHVATQAQDIFGPTLDMRLFTQVPVPTPWKHWLLPTDPDDGVDLSKFLYRCVRVVGGSWTESLKSDTDLARLASHWAEANQLDSMRTCPLCCSGAGTPRHTVMTCSGMRHLSNLLRKDMETLLGQLVEREQLLQRATVWRQECRQQGRAHLIPHPSAQDAREWPVLASWRWLVTLPGREALLSQDVGGHSATAVAHERGWDMGHRAILPSVLGRTLCRLPPPRTEREPPEDLEEYAVWRHTEQTTREAEQLQHRHARIRPAVECVSLLLLGLRRIRVEYARRINAWKQMQLIMEQARIPDVAPLGQVPAAGDDRPPSVLDAWFATPRGLTTARELRWLESNSPPPAHSVLALTADAAVVEHSVATAAAPCTLWDSALGTAGPTDVTMRVHWMRFPFVLIVGEFGARPSKRCRGARPDCLCHQAIS